MADRPEQPSLPISLDPPVPQPLQDRAFEALFGLGPVAHDAAVRHVASHYCDLGIIPAFKKLHQKSATYRHVETVIRALVRAERADRPEPDNVRAVRPQADSYTEKDWDRALDAVLTTDLVLREQAVRDAAQWARANLGLQYQRLTVRGAVYQGLDAAIERSVDHGDAKIVAEEYIRRLL